MVCANFILPEFCKPCLFLCSIQFAQFIVPYQSKSVFPTDDSLLKMLYLAMVDITKKWTGRRQDWSMIHAQMAVYFADRMPE